MSKSTTLLEYCVLDTVDVFFATICGMDGHVLAISPSAIVTVVLAPW